MASRSAALTLDLAAMQKRRADIVEEHDRRHRGAVQGRRRHGACRQRAGCCAGRVVEVTRARRRACSSCAARHVVLATGSAPIELPFAAVRRQAASSIPGARWNSTRCPKRLGVIGAGVIGLELGSVWRRLGAEVVVLEALDSFLPMADRAARGRGGAALQEAGARHPPRRQGQRRRARAGDGVTVQLRRRARASSRRGRPARRRRRPPAVHRRTCWPTDAGVQLDERGFIDVDDHCRTGVAERLGRRRLRARPDAGAQGQGGGRRRSPTSSPAATAT